MDCFCYSLEKICPFGIPNLVACLNCFLHKIVMICSRYHDRLRPSLIILNASPHRFGCAIFSNDAGQANIRIQCQLPEFSKVFGSGALFKKSPLSRLHFFAPLRLRVNHLHPHGVRRGLMYLTRRREGAKRKKQCAFRCDSNISTATIAICHDVDPAAFCHMAILHNISAKGKPSPASSAGRRGGYWPESKSFPT